MGGAFVGGMTVKRTWGKTTLIGGSDYIPFVLPTDVFDTSHFLIGLGAGVQTKVHDTDIFAFAGATSNEFDSPFFQGARAEDPAGVVFLKKQLTDHLTMTSNMVFSHQVTAIQGLEWTPEKNLEMSASAGVGGNQPYGAAAMVFNKPWMDMKAEYVEAGSQFHRAALDAPLTSEPDRENINVTVRPASFLSFGAGRNNYLSPVTGSVTEVRSDVNSVSGAVRVLGTGISASLYQSSFEGASNDATAYSADRKIFSRLHANSSYMESRPSDAPIDEVVCDQSYGEPVAAAGCERADQPVAGANHGIVWRRAAFKPGFGDGGVPDVLCSGAELVAVCAGADCGCNDAPVPGNQFAWRDVCGTGWEPEIHGGHARGDGETGNCSGERDGRQRNGQSFDWEHVTPRTRPGHGRAPDRGVQR